MRSRPTLALASALGALLLAACGGGSSRSGSSSTSSTASRPPSSAPTSASSTATTSPAASSGATSQLSYEGIPLQSGPEIAPASTTQSATVDGVRCGATEQLVYHIHVHLAVYKDGQAYSLPAGIGIPGSVTQTTNQGPVAAGGQCIYWLHTHAPDGILHVESPTQRIYTLGNFFDEWHQPLSAGRVGGLSGKVHALFDGRPWTKNVRDIPLTPHALIQLDIGQPAPPVVTVRWAGTGL